jgi:hypothetical protein
MHFFKNEKSGTDKEGGGKLELHYRAGDYRTSSL